MLAAAPLHAGITVTINQSINHAPRPLAPHPQAFPDVHSHPEYRSMLSTTRHIVQTEGVGTLFAGLVPRSLRIVAAVFILNGTRSTLVDLLQQRRTGGAAPA